MTALTLTSPEMALLAGGSDSAARTACSFAALDDSTLALGLATLHSRGLLDMASGEPELVSAALVIAAALQQSTSVVTVTTVRPDEGGGLYLVRSADGDLLITPRALGCFDVDLLALPLAQVCREMVATLLTADDALIAVERVSASERSGFALRVDAGGGLSLAVSGDTSDGPRLVERTELDAVLERLLAPVAA